MKRFSMRMITQLLAITIAVNTLFCAPFTVFADSNYTFYDDFQDETAGEAPSKWNGDVNEVSSVSVIEEDGNKFMRINKTVSSALNPVVATKDNIDMPVWENGSDIVVEAKIRTNGNVNEKTLRIGYPKDEDYTDYQNTKHALFGTGSSGFKFFYRIREQGTASEYNQMREYQDAGIDFTGEEWNHLKAVIDTDNKTVEYYLDDELVVFGESSEFSMASEDFSGMESIGNITFKWYANSTNSGEYMDVDDVKLYYINGAPTAEIIYDVGDEIPANAEGIKIQFDKPMDEQSLNVNTIKLYNVRTEDEFVCENRDYDSETRTYFIKFDTRPEVGDDYKIVFGDVYSANTEDYYSTGKIAEDTILTFSVCAEVSTDATLSSIKVDGVEIEEFSKDTLSYNIELKYEMNMTKPVIEATPSDAGASVEIIPSDDIEGTIAIVVLAEDGMTTLTYTVTITVVGAEVAELAQNLYPEGDFESGLVNWGKSNDSAGGEPWTGVQLSDAMPYAGTYSGLITGRTGDAYFYPVITVEKNKTYLVSAMVRLANQAAAGLYNARMFDIAGATYLYANENVISVGEGWNHMLATFESGSKTVVKPAPMIWDENVDYYIDDVYVGELVIADIEYLGDTSAVIPTEDEEDKIIELKAKPKNQFGTDAGLYNEVLNWRLVNEYDGVGIEDGNLVISKDAHAGVIELESVCNPSFTGASQSEVIRKHKIILNAHNQKAPQARNVTLSGTVKTGESLTLDYDYYQVDGLPEEDTEIKWYYYENQGDAPQEIRGANGLTLEVDGYEDYYIYATITPRANNGVKGQTVKTDILRSPVPPVASGVSVTGTRAVGEILTGIYTYSDGNSDEQSGTSFRWLIADSADGDYDVIEGATELTYTIREEDVDKYIKFEVTPKTAIEPTDGEPALSTAVLCATTPVVSNIKIDKISSTMFGAQYEYSHPNDIVEGATICRWYKDGKLVHTGSSYEISKNTDAKIKLEVIPVATMPPYEGEAESATITVKNKSQKVSSGGGGGGGGGSVIVPVPTPVVTPEEPVVTPDAPKEDTNVYWAADAIKYVLENNIMQNPKQDDFCDNETVTRAEFVYYIVTALGFGETKYNYEFEDVLATDWYANALQTAVDKGIISKADKFYPDREVARDEICKILVESVGDSDISAEVLQTSIDTFTDKDEIAQWAVEYVKKAVAMELMNGMGNNIFMPRGNVTRAQTAVLVKRVAEYK